ncbi:MAG: NupC/NupG family nucleoside CNT transporter [bacterium]
MGPEFYCGLFGLLALPFIAWLISADRSFVMWKTVVGGLLIQLVLGVLVLLTKPGQLFFQYMNDVVLGLLKFSDRGAEFLFGDLVNAEFAGAQFAFSVLPTIIFFSSLMAILYYSGIMQKVVEFVAWIIMKILGTSGAETLSISANIFVGQTEAPLVIRPFVKNMTMSELNTVMTGGFATVAGGVMAAYVGMLHQYFPEIAGHLITASIMSAPAAIVMSKLAFPEQDTPETRGEVQIDVQEKHQNVIDAAASGARSGLKLALNVGSMLLAFIALVYMGNFVMEWSGRQVYWLVTGLTGLSAFGWGAVLGGIISALFIARTAWTLGETKYWFGGLALVFLLPVAGYFLLPELVVTHFDFPGGGNLWAQIGGWSGLAFGVIFSFYSLRSRLASWWGSLGALIIGSVIFGLITYILGGSGSAVGAAAFSAGFILLVISSFAYWYEPSVKSALVVLFSVLIAAGLAALVTHLVDLEVLVILQELTLQKTLGYLFSGLAFLIGIPWPDLVTVGQLIGEKIAVNEFVAFLSFQKMAESGVLMPRSMVIVTYALTGFANFSSIAIQIGGIGGIAPSRSEDLAKLGLRAMTAGVLASSQTAAVAGVMFGIAELVGIQLATIG